jgi:hypothetical protein
MSVASFCAILNLPLKRSDQYSHTLIFAVRNVRIMSTRLQRFIAASVV